MCLAIMVSMDGMIIKKNDGTCDDMSTTATFIAAENTFEEFLPIRHNSRNSIDPILHRNRDTNFRRLEHSCR